MKLFVAVPCTFAAYGVGAFAAASPGIAACGEKIQAYHLQDINPRFQKKWRELAAQIPDMYAAVRLLGGEYGYGQFSDKPLDQLGAGSDYCLALQRRSDDSDVSDLVYFINQQAKDPRATGGDYAQAVFEALLRASLTNRTGLSPYGTSRLLVVVTDSISHLEGDVRSVAGVQLPANALNTPMLNSQGTNAKCNAMEYPSLSSVASALSSTQVLLLTPPGPASEMVAVSSGNAGAWLKEKLTAAGVTVFTESVAEDLSDLSLAFRKGLDQYNAWRCAGAPYTPVSDDSATGAKPTTSPSLPSTPSLQPTTPPSVPANDDGDTDGDGASGGGNSPSCSFTYDLLHLQDQGPTFQKLWRTMSGQIGGIVSTITADKGRYGFATFSDKDLHGRGRDSPTQYYLGDDDDYCLEEHGKIGQVSPAKMAKRLADWSTDDQEVGGDFAQATFEAIYRAIVSDRVGWSGADGAAASAVPRVIVLVTNAISHTKGDVNALTGRKVAKNYVSPSLLDRHGLNEDCDDMDYPSLGTVAAALGPKVPVIVLALPGGNVDKSGKFTADPALRVLGDRYNVKEGVGLWYRDQFMTAGVTTFVENVEADLSNFPQAFTNALAKYKQWKCTTAGLGLGDVPVVVSSALDDHDHLSNIDDVLAREPDDSIYPTEDELKAMKEVFDDFADLAERSGGGVLSAPSDTLSPESPSEAAMPQMVRGGSSSHAVNAY